jgi:hypothetical protein
VIEPPRVEDRSGSAGHGAPWRIHSTSPATSSGLSDSSGGIFRSPLRRAAWTTRLCSGSPGTIAGPRSPPLVARRFESSRKPDSCLAAPWHLMQCVVSRGRTWFSNRASWSRSDATVTGDSAVGSVAKINAATNSVPHLVRTMLPILAVQRQAWKGRAQFDFLPRVRGARHRSASHKSVDAKSSKRASGKPLILSQPDMRHWDDGTGTNELRGIVGPNPERGDTLLASRVSGLGCELFLHA